MQLPQETLRVFEVRFTNTRTLGNVSCQHCERPYAHSVSQEETISLSTSHLHRRLPAHIWRKGLRREPQLPLAEHLYVLSYHRNIDPASFEAALYPFPLLYHCRLNCPDLKKLPRQELQGQKKVS